MSHWDRRAGRRAGRRAVRRTVGVDAGVDFDPTTYGITWHTVWWGHRDVAQASPVSSLATSGTVAATLAQATGANQPLFSTAVAALNDMPGITFADATDLLVSSDFGAPVTQPYTLVFAGTIAAASGDGIRATAAGSVEINRTAAGVIRGYAGGANATESAVNNGNLHIIRFHAAGAGSDIEVDGTVTSNDATGTSNATALGIGPNSGGACYLFGLASGDIAGANWTDLLTDLATVLDVTIP